MCSFAVLLWEEPGKTAAFFIILMIICGLFASVSSFVTLFATLFLIVATSWILVAALWIPLRWELPNNIFRYILNDML